MSEIKFRAWEKSYKRMSKVIEIKWKEEHLYHQIFTQAIVNNKRIDDSYTYDFSGVSNGIVLMQYTGLKDKNGVEIYEGDIVVQDGYIWFYEGKPNYRGTVEWIYSQWQVIAHCVNPDNRGISDGMNYGLNDEGFDEGENSDWEVIGNIHDNPELVED